MVVGETHHFRSCPHIRDDTLPSNIGIIISHYKDPYFTTSIEKNHLGIGIQCFMWYQHARFMNHETRIPSLTNQDDSWKVSEFFFFFRSSSGPSVVDPDQDVGCLLSRKPTANATENWYLLPWKLAWQWKKITTFHRKYIFKWLVSPWKLRWYLLWGTFAHFRGG